ncbi:MAG: hypothetical protein C0501_17315 [Isosphaera sp.]|nr:hypothetical protein [Isosphaera sp.]
MSVRVGLFGLVAAAGVAGAAPIDPPPEGREPNPVVREFYGAEPATFAYVAPAAAPAGGWWFGALWDGLVERLTVPLGTVPMEVWD